jgi:uncharacterized RDD family membrane protein YckC
MAWYLSEYVSMQLNKRSRAIHDFIGGTVVLKSGNGPGNSPHL